MICPECGCEVPDGERKCIYCGADLNTVPWKILVKHENGEEYSHTIPWKYIIPAIIIAGCIGLVIFIMTRHPSPLPQNGRLTGSVVDSSSKKGLVGVEVTVTDLDGKEYSDRKNMDTSDKNGDFYLELPPGKYKLHFKAEGYEDLDPSGSYTVIEDKDTDISKQFGMAKYVPPTPKNGRLTGYVADLSDGKMMADVKVTVTDQNGKEYADKEYTAASDKDGAFCLELPPGTYKLHFKAEGYDDLDSAESYTITEDKDTDISEQFEMNQTVPPLPENGSLKGYVVDSASKKGLVGVEVTVTDLDGKEYSDRENMDTSDKNGAFYLELPPGKYKLHFKSEGYDDLDPSSSYMVTEAKDTDISELFEMEQTVPPPPQNGRLTGYVADLSDGKMMANVNVTVTDQSGKEYTDKEYTATSDKDGYFRLELPPGTYKLHFKAEGYDDLDPSNYYTVAEDKDTEISDPIMMTLYSPPPPKNGRLTGYVYDSSSKKGLVGVDVTVTDLNGKKYSDRENMDTSNKDGSFYLELPPGTYKLHFKAEGYDDLDSSGSYTVAEDKDTNISGQFSMNKYVPPTPKNGWLTGHVYDTYSTRKLYGVKVTATDQNGKEYTDYENTDSSDTNGYFRLSLPPGKYKLHLRKEGYDNLDTANFYTVYEDDDTDVEQKLIMKKPPVTCKHSINSSEKEDYSRNLNPKEYISYSSSNDREFYFSFPAHLFYKTECSFDSYGTLIGKNIETHTFYGSRGTVVSFSLIKRTDSRALKDAINFLYSKESAEIKNKKKKHLSYEKDGFPGFAVSGVDEYGNIIYRLTRVYSGKVMELRILFPSYKNEEDKIQKQYVTECIYRMCSFKNAVIGAPRSYSDFKKNF